VVLRPAALGSASGKAGKPLGGGFPIPMKPASIRKTKKSALLEEKRRISYFPSQPGKG